MAIKKLDVVTQVCPFPLIEAKAALAEMASGDELVIEFDCTQATEAIPQWAAEDDAPRDKRTYFREINYIAAAFQYQKKNYKSA
ncbi:sulfurtransferase TusA family protein [Escherichia coli]|nr:sulfurtransferase TusA family protein [Escherichia coli]